MNLIRAFGNGARWPHLRTVLSACVVLLLVHLARAKDLFADFSRPTVLVALHLLGIDAADHGPTITVGRLEIPWTRDCAGLNLLLVLVALTIWVNRAETAGLRYWTRIALAAPAALLANVLRVLSLIAYREAFYPKVESPQLHYFLGLVWLLPFLILVVPKGTRPFSHVFVEALQAAAVVALLAPMSGVPGGSAITIAAIICLAHGKVQTDALGIRTLLAAGWMAAALGIALVGMESLWMPWLLVCPMLVSWRWISSVSGILLTLGCYPLFGMIPGGTPVIWLAVGIFCWQQSRPAASGQPSVPVSAPELRRWWQIHPHTAAAFFVLPFIASTIFARERESFVPPPHTAFTAIASDTYEVRVPGQPENVGLLWFNPSGQGRHHSMKVCMKYRGVDLEATDECADVFTDGQKWMREFYIVDSKLIPSYSGYLMRTFRPGSSPGVHLIFITRCEDTTAIAFDRSCQQLASQLYDNPIRER